MGFINVRTERQLRKWAYSRISRVRRSIASWIQYAVEQLLGIRFKQRIPVKEAYLIPRILRGERVRAPQIYSMIRDINPRIAKRWHEILRKRYQQPEMRQLIDQILERVERLRVIEELYRALIRHPETVLARLVKFAPAIPYRSIQQANCVLLSYGLPPIGDIIVDGRLCMPGDLIIKVLKALRDLEPNLPIYMVWWKDDCIKVDPDIYVYRGKRPPKPKRGRQPCLKALGDRQRMYTADEILSYHYQSVLDAASSDYVCIYTTPFYAGRIPDHCKRL